MLEVDAPRGAYRGGAGRCPGCLEALHSEQLGSAVVERCEACHGMFLDWADGSVLEIAAAAGESACVSATAAAVDSRAQTSGALQGACVRCGAGLAEERLPGDVLVQRCAQCFGVFLSAVAIRELGLQAAEADAQQQAIEHESHSVALWRWLCAFFRM